MKSSKHSESKLQGGREGLPSRWLTAPALCLFLLCGAGLGTAHAQSTAGRLFGQAPAGSHVTAHSERGVRRHVTVKDAGRYVITSLPPGTYDVALETEGVTVDTRKNIPIHVGGGSEVDFACPQDKCSKP